MEIGSGVSRLGRLREGRVAEKKIAVRACAGARCLAVVEREESKWAAVTVGAPLVVGARPLGCPKARRYRAGRIAGRIIRYPGI